MKLHRIIFYKKQTLKGEKDDERQKTFQKDK